MTLAFWFGIAGAVVVLFGTFVLIGDQFPRFRRVFGRMNRRFGEIREGLDLLTGDLQKPRFLKKGESGFQEILQVIVERTREARAEISAIRYGCIGAEDSVERVHVALESKINGSPQYTTIATREVVEQWLYDALLRSLSRWGFSFVFCGVLLGIVSLIMQALGPRGC